MSHRGSNLVSTLQLRERFIRYRIMSASAKRDRKSGSNSSADDNPTKRLQMEFIKDTTKEIQDEKLATMISSDSEDENSNSDLVMPEGPNGKRELLANEEKKPVSVDDKLDWLISTVGVMNIKLEKLDQIELLEHDIANVKTNIDSLERKLVKKDSEIKALQNEVSELRTVNDRTIRLEAYSRRDNLLIDGLAAVTSVETEEKCKQLVYDFLVTKLGIADARERMQIVRAHRIGTSAGNKPRTMIVRFHFFPHKQEVWNARFKLKGSKLWLAEDFPNEISKERQLLKPYFNSALAMGLKPKMVFNKLIIAGKSYSVERISEIPDSISERAVFNLDDKTVFFHGYKHPFSNIYPAPFRNDGLDFKCAEQYIQYRKAELCGNRDAAEKILHAKELSSVTHIYRSLRSTNSWQRMHATTVKTAAYLKFKQNLHLKKLLLATGDRILAAAIPSDKEWGTGLRADDPRSLVREDWPGENRLGSVLMEVREQLRALTVTGEPDDHE